MTRQGFPDRQPSDQPPGDRPKTPAIRKLPISQSPLPRIPAPIDTAQPPPPQAIAIAAEQVAVPSTVMQRIRKRMGWLTSWQFLIVASLVFTSGTGAFALSLLLKLPGLPNCPAIFWPLASASLRFECARLAANKQTISDLLEAIKLLEPLPADHELRTEADRLIEQWSQDVLRLAEEAFNAGKLNEAIAAARRIPNQVSAYKLVEERVQRWQSIWSKAEAIFKKAENEMRELNWRGAFVQAVQLLDVENTFWQTTKYDELTSRINAAREDGNKLAKAERLADQGGVDNLLEAIKLVESIGPDSYVRKAAQGAIGKFGRALLGLAEDALDRRDLQRALNILGKVPEVTNLKEETKDLTTLAYAQSQTWTDMVSSLEDAISQAQKIGPNRPLYGKAQQLIGSWQQEIEAIQALEKARMLAQGGSTEDLRAAVAAASQVSQSNPRWSKVQKQVQEWTDSIQTTEDRPILDQADETASPGDIPALQAAINQVNQIGRGRALSRDAQRKVDEWTAQIQQIQDQPFLDQAQTLANAGDLTAAIAAAEQVKSGRSLYSEAQSSIRDWRKQIQDAKTQIQAEQTLQEARRLANSGSTDALGSAIQLVNQVPSTSRLRSDADGLIEEWSRQLLQVAETRAGYDVPGAIAVAQKIPSRAAAFAEAQRQIQAWRKTIGQ
ncbi:chromosome segregation ATPase [Leptolyngbya sp. FACHB-36]|uniref:chromosome segregation ATPase n=1 Tax=Leptolyngbya sp. FACHB-36 TaxID=2692808 RepID=UPI0016802A18|nr:chromosome segregation ATPase [Leptolyngbya sp. FACHB-36]MBD2019130.1 chromosome segregation ATPase [Leptolyngbya sp. FACHB-36]